MTGWGQDGPLAQVAGHDIDYIAVAGALRHIGRVGDKPTPPINLLGDFGGGGMFLVLGVVCGVLEARTSGRGQVVDAAMIDGVSVLMTMVWGLRSIGVLDQTAPGTNLIDTGAPFYDTYECADGRYVAIGSLEPALWRAPHRVGLDPATLPRPDDRSAWPQPRRASGFELFRTRTRNERCRAFDGHDGAPSPVLTMTEAAAHPQVTVLCGTIVEHDGVLQPAPGAALLPHAGCDRPCRAEARRAHRRDPRRGRLHRRRDRGSARRTRDRVTGSSIFGNPVRRVEDPGFLTGRTQYFDDLTPVDTADVVFVRSNIADATVTAVNTRNARPGCRACSPSTPWRRSPSRPLRPSRLYRPPSPGPRSPTASSGSSATASRPCWPRRGPRPSTRRDASSSTTSRCRSSIDPESLAPGAPVLFREAGSNVAVDVATTLAPPDPTVLDEGADVVVHARFVNQRLAAVPMEPNGLLAVPTPDAPDPEPLLTLHMPSQAPHWARDEYAEKLDLPRARVRVIAGWVGGGFGAKVPVYPEQLVTAKLAVLHGRPVRYVESRSENLTGMTQGRAQVQDVRLAATKGGELLGMRVRLIADCGAYPAEAAFMAQLTRMMAPGVYRLPHIDYGAVCVVTNATPIGAYRGAGRPEAAALIERMVDMVAAELGLDPVEVRRRNLVATDAFPYTTSTNTTYDVGDYPKALDEALRLAGYEDLRRQQAERRARGDRLQLGIGVCYVRSTGCRLRVRLGRVGRCGAAVTVLTGVSPHGQGTTTGIAQIAAGLLGVPFERVTVLHSDTDAGAPRGGHDGLAVAAEGRQRRPQGGEPGDRQGEADRGPRAGGRTGGRGVRRRPVLDRRRAAGAHRLGGGRRRAADPDGAPGHERGPGGDRLRRRHVVPVRRPRGGRRGGHRDRRRAADPARRGRRLRHDRQPLLVDGQQHGGLGQGIAQALYEVASTTRTGTR